MGAICKDGIVYASTQAQYMTTRINGQTFSLQNIIGETITDLATIETETTASRNYSVGELLVLEGVPSYDSGLYKVIAAITEGDEFDTLVNIEKTNISNELMDVGTRATYNATSPIVINAATRTVSHAASGITAGQIGPATNQQPTFGSTFSTFAGNVNASGHLTGLVARTVKIPDTVATTTAAGLMSAMDKSKLDNIDNFLDLRYTVLSTF